VYEGEFMNAKRGTGYLKNCVLLPDAYGAQTDRQTGTDIQRQTRVCACSRQAQSERYESHTPISRPFRSSKPASIVYLQTLQLPSWQPSCKRSRVSRQKSGTVMRLQRWTETTS